MRATRAAASTHRELERVIRLLEPLEIATSPFTTRPETNERPHWTKPSLVAQLEIHRVDRRRTAAPSDLSRHEGRCEAGDGETGTEIGCKRCKECRGVAKSAESAKSADKAVVPTFRSADNLQSVIDQLDEIERGSNSGTLRLPDGETLEVSNLRKVFWPKLKITKGDLMRYYVRVAPYILPVVDDRPLIMKRFPNGIDGEPFYQHNAPENVPPGVRVAKVPATASRAA